MSAGVPTAFYNNIRRAVSPEGEAKLAALHARMKSAQRFGEGATTLQTHMNMLRFFVSGLTLGQSPRAQQQRQLAWCRAQHTVRWCCALQARAVGPTVRTVCTRASLHMHVAQTELCA